MPAWPASRKGHVVAQFNQDHCGAQFVNAGQRLQVAQNSLIVTQLSEQRLPKPSDTCLQLVDIGHQLADDEAVVSDRSPSNVSAL
jgi:hypothetical protein